MAAWLDQHFDAKDTLFCVKNFDGATSFNYRRHSAHPFEKVFLHSGNSGNCHSLNSYDPYSFDCMHEM